MSTSTRCFAIAGNDREAVPDYVKELTNHCEAFIYIDSTIIEPNRVGPTLVIAHECRHAWQFFNSEVLYHAGVVLYFVVDYLAIPTEIDAEAEAKHTWKRNSAQKQ